MDHYIEIIESEKLDEAQNLLRALSHKLRLQIVDYLDKNPSCNVKQIYKDLGIEQSVTSQHLRILRDTNVVNSERQGKIVIYNVNYDLIRNASIQVDRFI